MKRIKKIVAILLAVFVMLMAVSCTQYNAKDPFENGEEDKNSDEPNEEDQDTQEENPKVVITLWNDKKIRLELYPSIAPITVANFMSLVDKGYYTNTVFHRIIKGFMIQAGWIGIMEEGLYYKPSQENIKGEFSSNGHPNFIKHELGVISMARAADPDSASTQFFICSDSSPHLDRDYAAFGRTIDDESNQTVVELSGYPTGILYGMKDFPITPDGGYVIIKSIERLTDE
ncbi:MAG: peptidylprolyl isomerase [Clostridia bacterium]